MSVFLLRFPSPLIPGRHFLGNLNPNARIIEFGIAISPAVILLLRDVPRLQQGGLLFPGLKPLLKIRRADSAVKDCRPDTDHAIHIGDSDQIPVLQGKKRAGYPAVHFLKELFARLVIHTSSSDYLRPHFRKAPASAARPLQANSRTSGRCPSLWCCPPQGWSGCISSRFRQG